MPCSTIKHDHLALQPHLHLAAAQAAACLAALLEAQAATRSPSLAAAPLLLLVALVALVPSSHSSSSNPMRLAPHLVHLVRPPLPLVLRQPPPQEHLASPLLAPPQAACLVPPVPPLPLEHLPCRSPQCLAPGHLAPQPLWPQVRLAWALQHQQRVVPLAHLANLLQAQLLACLVHKHQVSALAAAWPPAQPPLVHLQQAASAVGLAWVVAWAVALVVDWVVLTPLAPQLLDLHLAPLLRPQPVLLVPLVPSLPPAPPLHLAWA